MRPLMILAAIALTTPALAAAPTVTGATIRSSPVTGRPSAGFFTMSSKTADRLVAVTAPGVRIEMHTMDMSGGIMRMRAIDGVDLQPGVTVTFAPGGNHLMIYDLKPGVVALPLTFKMKSGDNVTVTAPVRPAEGTDMAMPHGSHGGR